MTPIKCFFLVDTTKTKRFRRRDDNGKIVAKGESPIYRRVDTGEEFLQCVDMPVGAMWYAPWLDVLCKPQLEHVLIVKTPGGDWCVDFQASNCTMPNPPIPGTKNRYSRYQEDHHCWIIHGTPPEITVDKNGVTCAAGAGSIQQGTWHGFLQNGYLVE